MLVDRDDALGELTAALAGAAEGRGCAVVVEGTAGLGKTAIVDAAAAMAADRGLRVLRAAGGEIEQDLPWGVVRDLLARPSAAAGLLPAAGPAAAAALGGGGQAPPDPLAALPSLLDLLSALAEGGPLLVAVDDAHWCDAASALWLAYLGGRIARLPVLLLVAARPADPRRPAALTTLVARDGVRTTQLRPLGAADGATLVRRAVPQADDALCRACQDATGGNLFLLTELTRELAAAAEPSAALVADLSIERVERAVARRLLAAGADAAGLARAVALLGADADAFTARTLSGLDPVAAARAEDALRAAGLLAADRVPGRLALAHPLFRAAVERAIPAGERSLLHLTAARQLADAGARPDVVGAQLLAVEPGGDPWVRDALLAAADEAERSGAPAVVKALLGRAVAERAGPVDAEVFRRLGRAAVLVDPSAAVAPLRAALEATTDLAERVAIALDLSVALQGAAGFDESVAMLGALADELEPLDPGLWWRVEAERLSQGYFSDRARARRPRDLAAARARYTGAHPAERLVLLQLAVDEVDRGTAARARALVHEAWDDGRLAEAAGGLGSAVAMWCPYVLLYTGDLATAEAVVEPWLEDVARRGAVAEGIYGHAILAEAQLRQGRLREAEASAQAAWEPASAIGPSFTGWWIALGDLAQAVVAQGRAGEARALLERHGVLDGPPPRHMVVPQPGIVRAQVLLATGDVERGVEELLAARAWLTEVGVRSPGAYWYPADLVEGLLRCGREQAARDVAEAWSAEAESFGEPVLLGLARRAHALVEGSVDGLAAAAAMLARTPARFEHARSLVELGAAVRRAGRPGAAREPLREALDAATRMAATGLAERARDELVATGARPRRGALRGVDALTAGELRVARLVAEGRSNPEVAAALFVTRKTVEKHLAGAYAKLGIASRAELAGALDGDRSPGREPA